MRRRSISLKVFKVPLVPLPETDLIYILKSIHSIPRFDCFPAIRNRNPQLIIINNHRPQLYKMFARLSQITGTRLFNSKQRSSAEPKTQLESTANPEAQEPPEKVIEDTEVLESVDNDDGYACVQIRKMTYAEACSRAHPITNKHSYCKSPFSVFDEEAWAVKEVESHEEQSHRNESRVSDYVLTNIEFNESPYINKINSKSSRGKRRRRKSTRKHDRAELNPIRHAA